MIEKPETVSLALHLAECPEHRACTVVGFAVGPLHQIVHLPAEALRALHTRLGQRLLTVDVPRLVVASSS